MPLFQVPQTSHAPGQYSTNAVIERMQSQWQFSTLDLARTPSILDGMPAAVESANRSKGVNFITQVGILLKLPQLTLATASVYLHRFFMRHSMVDLPNRPGLHHYSVAATALFLATKVEENCRKMKELVVACCRVAQKAPNLIVDEQSKEYWKWRDTILRNEDLLLEALCFDLQLEQPYKILYEFLCGYGKQENKKLRNTSWAFLNDSYLTTMCLLYSPRTIAGSAFYAGARLAELAFPDDENGRPWWEQLDLDLFEIQQACNLMADVYENSTLPHQNQKEAYIRESDTSSLEKTRSAATPRRNYSPARSVGTESQGFKRDREEYNEDKGNGQNGHSSDEGNTTQPGRHVQDVPPSPKRQRRSPLPTGESVPLNGAGLGPPHAASEPQPNNGAQIDDVQQKIDDIINAAGVVDAPYPHPTLSRRPSGVQHPPWPGPPLRRRSSSISNKARPASAHSNTQMGSVEYRPPPARNPSFDRAPREANGGWEPNGRIIPDPRPEEGFDRGNYEGDRFSHESRPLNRESRPSQETGQGEQPTNRGALQRVFNGSTEVDDSEKVDYGSEEGEL